MTGYEAGTVFERAKTTIESISYLTEDQICLFQDVLIKAIAELRTDKVVKEDEKDC